MFYENLLRAKSLPSRKKDVIRDIRALRATCPHFRSLVDAYTARHPIRLQLIDLERFDEVKLLHRAAQKMKCEFLLNFQNQKI